MVGQVQRSIGGLAENQWVMVVLFCLGGKWKEEDGSNIGLTLGYLAKRDGPGFIYGIGLGCIYIWIGFL